MQKLLKCLKRTPDQGRSSRRFPEGQLAQVAGVTTFAKKDVQTVLKRRNAGQRWYGELEASLQSDEQNPVDPNAVNVMVDGLRFGCLPSYLSAEMGLRRGEIIPAVVQVFVGDSGNGQHVAAWVWFGSGEPMWQWSRKSFPPMTTQERSSHSHAASKKMVKDRLAEGGWRADEIKRGMVDGVHYLELVEPIKQLKREGRLEEALALCYQAIEGAEKDRGNREAAPAYTIDAAIIHRKLGQRQEEIKVLERWMSVCPEERRVGSRVAVRLEKLTRS